MTTTPRDLERQNLPSIECNWRGLAGT